MKKCRRLLIGDLHFFDKNIINFERQNFDEVNLMNNTIISNWNREVGKDDLVYVLGDVASKYVSIEKITEVIKQLKGYKVLILGNHDDQFTADEWRQIGFDEVIAYPIVVDDFCILSHEPMYVNESSPYINIYAHVHKNPSYNDFSSRSACVSAERIGLTPINFDVVVKKIEEKAYK